MPQMRSGAAEDMGNLLRVIGILAVAMVVSVLGYSVYISMPQFDDHIDLQSVVSVELAPTELALTFARYDRSGAASLLLVSRVESGVLYGIELEDSFPGLGHDAMALYKAVGHEPLAALLSIEPSIAVPIAQLVQPMDFNFPFIAAGTNYKDHADEVYVDDPPFIFPKLARTTNWNAGVDARSSSHLDYEAEICLVPLEDINAPTDEVPMGLLLCNDFTDRWILVNELEFGLAMGTTGFASAKGRPGYLPVGYLLVIPRSPEFYQDISLQLYVNERMRQNIQADMMILKPLDIVRQAFASAQQTYYRGDEIVPLLPGGKIPAGTLLLSGTGGGVIFKPLNVWNPFLYLKAGDRVTTVADYLGHLDNRILNQTQAE
jgi:2,4-diketo-3-deoxy-L-fuconate hydrolase